MKKLRKVSLPASISVIALVAVFAVFVGVRAYQSEAPSQNVFEEGSVNTIVNAANESQIPDDPIVGATASPVVPYNFMQINGITTYYNNSGLATATNTPCAFKSPSATSTLVHASVSFSTATSVASVITLAKASTPYATTTLVTTDTAVGADNQATILASSTSEAYLSARLFEPDQYFVVGMNGGSAATGSPTYSPVGRCQAIFQVLSE